MGTVGVYLLRHGNDDTLETLVHRRSERVNDFRDAIATPGGMVDRSDCIDEHDKVNKEHGFRCAMVREVYEETGINLEGFPQDHIWNPEHCNSSTHRNYVIYFNASLKHAMPQPKYQWEMTKGGVHLSFGIFAPARSTPSSSLVCG